MSTACPNEIRPENPSAGAPQGADSPLPRPGPLHPSARRGEACQGRATPLHPLCPDAVLARPVLLRPGGTGSVRQYYRVADRRSRKDAYPRM